MQRYMQGCDARLGFSCGSSWGSGWLLGRDVRLVRPSENLLIINDGPELLVEFLRLCISSTVRL